MYYGSEVPSGRTGVEDGLGDGDGVGDGVGVGVGDGVGDGDVLLCWVIVTVNTYSPITVNLLVSKLVNSNGILYSPTPSPVRSIAGPRDATERVFRSDALPLMRMEYEDGVKT